MSRQIVVPNGDIPNLGDNISNFEENRNFLGDRLQEQQQCDNKKVDNNEDVRIPAIKGMKIATPTANAKPTVRKLLMASTKVLLVKYR